jgi:hypothetical protein
MNEHRRRLAMDILAILVLLALLAAGLMYAARAQPRPSQGGDAPSSLRAGQDVTRPRPSPLTPALAPLAVIMPAA